jgi:hypothetical protein
MLDRSEARCSNFKRKKNFTEHAAMASNRLRSRRRKRQKQNDAIPEKISPRAEAAMKVSAAPLRPRRRRRKKLRNRKEPAVHL